MGGEVSMGYQLFYYYIYPGTLSSPQDLPPPPLPPLRRGVVGAHNVARKENNMANDKYGYGGRFGPGRYNAPAAKPTKVRTSTKVRVMDALLWGALLLVVVVVALVVLL